MRVLIVHPSFWIDGGAEKVIVKLCNYLTEHNIDNAILTTQMLPEIKLQLTETRIIEVGKLENMSDMLHQICTDFDVINIHNDPCQLLVYPKNMNAIWTFNELPSKIQLGGNLPEMEIKMVQNFIKKIIVADETNQRKVKECYGMDSTIIPYGIDYDFFQGEIKENMRERFGIEKDDLVITQVGFIAPTKNQLESVKILAEVKKKIPNAKLVLAGMPLEAYKKEVDAEILKNNLYADVIFTGKLSHEEIRDLLKTSDCALQPNKGQGSWLSVFEAMACDVPVIVSEEFTANDLVKNKGYVGNFVESIINIYEDKTIISSKPRVDKTLTYKINGKSFAQSLTWDNYCSKVVEVFNENN